MIDEQRVQRWANRLGEEIPGAVAVFLVGSQLTGDAGPHSDLDFNALVERAVEDSPSPFDAEDGRLLRVSVWIRELADWWSDQGEPQEWAFGLAVSEQVRLCWAADESWRRRLDRSRIDHPGAPPELDHFLGDLGKVANAHGQGDELGLRLAAQDLARSCPSLLAPLNPHPPVASRRAAIRTALGFEVVPPGYRDDLPVCLGLAGKPATPSEVHAAACRLATGMTELLISEAARYTPLLTSDLAAQLADGSLRWYVGQLVSSADESG
jgi:phosphoribosyl-AMP cyclohydrolase